MFMFLSQMYFPQIGQESQGAMLTFLILDIVPIFNGDHYS